MENGDITITKRDSNSHNLCKKLSIRFLFPEMEFQIKEMTWVVSRPRLPIQTIGQDWKILRILETNHHGISMVFEVFFKYYVKY